MALKSDRTGSNPGTVTYCLSDLCQLFLSAVFSSVKLR